MPRSVKKGPFIDASLMKKVETMNTAGEKKILKTFNGFGVRPTWVPDGKSVVSYREGKFVFEKVAP